MSNEIPQDAIDVIAHHINTRNNKNYNIPVVGISDNPETPQYFEIIPFTDIDLSDTRFYAVDGSTNSQPFFNGLAIGIYRAGYVAFERGKQVRLNQGDNPIILGQAYTPRNILITDDDHKYAIYDELLSLPPVEHFIHFLHDTPENIFSYTREAVISGGLATLLGFCQEVLEWSLVYEIACRTDTKPYDFILRDGTLRSLNIKQKYLAKLGKFLSQDKKLFLIAITKNSPVKMELNYTFRQIDNYLQEKLKHKYPFKQSDPRQQKLCCWFEVSDAVLANAYGDSGGMYIKKGLIGGRGIGVFHAARLDYVEKLQNYDWVIADLNIFDAIPGIERSDLSRNMKFFTRLFRHLTRLTQEHYILGYPFPLVEAHNFVTLKSDLKEQIINRVKHSMYESQNMDHVDIENLFVDIHTRF
jgi:hypothetical protein